MMRDPGRLQGLSRKVQQAEAPTVEDLKQLVLLLVAEVEHLQREVDSARAIANRAGAMGRWR
jgi:hypothetical protein